MPQRRKYSEEFNGEAVGLTRLPSAKVSQIARDLGIRANQIHRWRSYGDGQIGAMLTGIVLASHGRGPTFPRF